MAKPTQDPKWVTTDDPVNIVEPTAGAKLNGITSGGIWARENLNWMFNALSKWVDWIRDFALDKSNNLSELTDKAVSRTNLEIPTYFLSKADNLNSVADKAIARSNLGTNNAVNITTGSINPSRLPAANTSFQGAVEKASTNEAKNGTVDRYADAYEIKNLYLSKEDNLSTLQDKAIARSNLGANNAGNINTGVLSSVHLPDATFTIKGVVEKAMYSEVVNGTADKFPDATEIKNVYVQGASATSQETADGVVGKFPDANKIKSHYVQGEAGTQAWMVQTNGDNDNKFLQLVDTADYIASLVEGTLGTYVFAQAVSGGAASIGQTRAGSELKTSSAFGSIEGPETTLSGTWKCMGMINGSDTARNQGASTLWMRIV